MRYFVLYSSLFYITLLVSCRKDEPLITNYQATPVKLENPFTNFPDMIEPEWNPTTEEGLYLGRKLYYDNILSMNGLSCSSCHPQSDAFTVPFIGPNGMQVIPHINIGWNTSYGWNGGRVALDSVALDDLAEGNVFLNANNDSIKERLKNHPDYPYLFKEAFNVDIVEISLAERQKFISYALAQFMRSIISANSRFDQHLVSKNILTPLELYGFDVFMREDKGDCFHCHGDNTNPLWKDNLFHNNGLNSTHSGHDLGRYLVTNNPNDIGKFRTPTLRNIELTAPYMHDGRYNTLEEVVDFYSSGLQHSSTIDPLMKNVDVGGVMLTPADKLALIAFLKTLTDTDFLVNPDLSAL